ncbi:response regulator transcription factor [Mucilaginibacter sp. RS28]|uniref:Response regulator transcription factor n=1 Tax=Mucilaginibacter straminoryzae TaxID=2932774 RepID=A0A9X1X1W0_9SPHI|nr:response regulator transcription factor [Mucilaginibacter straminoryzae]MCJ8209707.1 response regulator transcription factor [Mucilaginibacter straminoryzae]
MKPLINHSLIKIGLIEDDPSLRRNYEEFFHNEPGFTVLFATSDLQKLKYLNVDESPNVILLDLLLPSGNSVYQISRLKKDFPQTKIVILSGMEEPALTKLAMTKGASGFLLKASSLQFIKDAIVNMRDSGLAVSPQAANHLFSAAGQLTKREFPELTLREKQLAEVLASGVSHKEAGDILGISALTVNQHLKSIYKKLRINSKLELVARFRNNGPALEPEESQS